MGITYYSYTHAVIDSPGDYTIDRDMTQSDPTQPCLTINPGVNYVNIRLRSRMVYSGPTSGLAPAIQGTNNAGVTILGDGGSINGFPFGIRMDNCYLMKIINVSVLSALFQGMYLSGDEGIVSGCDVRNVGGSTAYSPSRNFGIQISGARPKILRNYVENIFATEEAVGISVTDKGIDGIVAYNVMKCTAAPPPLSNGNPASYGLWVGGASKVSDELNLICGWAVGVAYSSVPSGDYGGNRYVGCTLDALINSPTVIKSTTD